MFVTYLTDTNNMLHIVNPMLECTCLQKLG